MRNSKPTARSLLLDLDPMASDDEIDELERLFFNQLVLANGTLKTTFANRLPDCDLACNSMLAEINRPVRLLDVGISSGVTTYEWMQSLSAQGVEFSMDAFDLCVDASIISFAASFHVLIDSRGRPLQFELAGKSQENFLGESVSRKLKRALPIGALRLTYWFGNLLFGRYLEKQPVKLVSHHLKEVPNVSVFEHDVANIDQLSGKYDMIRAANILNLAYFDDAFLRDVIAKVKHKLEDNGLLCVVRTHSDNSNHGTIFRYVNGALTPAARIGNGSELDALVLTDLS